MFNLALVTINLGPPVAFVTASSLTIADSEIPFKSLYVTAARLAPVATSSPGSPRNPLGPPAKPGLPVYPFSPLIPRLPRAPGKLTTRLDSNLSLSLNVSPGYLASAVAQAETSANSQLAFIPSDVTHTISKLSLFNSMLPRITPSGLLSF